MTKTEARRQARKQLRYGYFQQDAGLVYVRCPQCRIAQRVVVLAWATERERVKALETVLTHHLLEEHE